MGAFYFLVKKLTKEKLGAADVWFGFFQGLFIIPKLIPLCLLVEDCIAMIAINKRWGQKRFPFIPYMSIGLIICFILELFL